MLHLIYCIVLWYIKPCVRCQGQHFLCHIVYSREQLQLIQYLCFSAVHQSPQGYHNTSSQSLHLVLLQSYAFFRAIFKMFTFSANREQLFTAILLIAHSLLYLSKFLSYFFSSSTFLKLLLLYILKINS